MLKRQECKLLINLDSEISYEEHEIVINIKLFLKDEK